MQHLHTRWMALLLAVLALAACGSLPGQSVARVNNVTLSRQTLDQRIQLIQDSIKAESPSATAPSNQEIEQGLVQLFIEQNLVLDLARQRGVNVTDKEVDDQISTFRSGFEQQGGKLDDAVKSRLGFPDAASSDFRQFVTYTLAQSKVAETLVTTDTVKADITKQVEEQAAQKVKEYHSAHMLFAANSEAEFPAALEKANAALKRLEGGEDFATLAKELSEDPGSKDNGGEYDWQRQGNFVPEYEDAVLNKLQSGEYTKEPVKSQFGYHIIKLLEPVREVASIPAEQVQQVVDQQVAQELQSKRAEALNKLLEDEKAKAKQDGRLEEPTYPTATPVAPAETGAPEATTEATTEATATP